MPNDSSIHNLPLAIRSIGSEVYTSTKDNLKNLGETEIPNLYTASNAGSDKLYYFYKFDIGDEEKYIKISGPVSDIIDSGGVNQKSFFEHLQALIYPQQGSFSASLLHNRPDRNLTRIFAQSNLQNFGLVLALDPVNLSFGCDKTDGYSGCYDKGNEAVAFYGLFEKLLEILELKERAIKEYPDMFKYVDNRMLLYTTEQKLCERYGIKKSNFENAITAEFAKNDGKLIVDHIHPMDGDGPVTTTFYNSLEKMMQENVSGEILVHQLHTNQNDVIIMLPQVYQVESSLAAGDLEIATGLKKFFQEMTSRDVKFATLDSSQHKVTIVELDERGLISKSVNQQINSNNKTPSSSVSASSVKSNAVTLSDQSQSPA